MADASSRSLSWNADTKGLILVGAVAAMALLVDVKHAPNRDAVLEPAWTMAVYMVLPLAAVVWMDTAKKPAAWALAALGTLAVVVPVAMWAWWLPRGWFKPHPEWIVGPTALSLGLLLAAARVGEVRLGDWGLGRGDWRWWGPRFAGALAVIVPVIGLGAVLSPELLEYYPEYAPARESLRGLAAYQLGNGFYMTGWEFFFRGFLLFGVARYAGVGPAILLQAVPFMLLHSTKPELEMAASFGGSVFLGWFCWRGRCFWPAVVLHWSLNGVMEILGFFW